MQIEANSKLQEPARVPLQSGEPETLIGIFELALTKHKRPDALNFKRGGTWRSLSSGEVLERAGRIALGLFSLGIKQGDRVGLLSENCPEWTLTDAGCLYARAIDVPIYPTLTPSQVGYILKDSGARALFVSTSEKFDQIREALLQCPAIKNVIILEDCEQAPTRSITLRELEERGRNLAAEDPDLLSSLTSGARPEDLATIIYTSGTTGEPKGVMLTHSNLVSNIIDCSSQLSFGETDIALSVLPLSHVYERLAMYMYIHHGMSVYFAESMEKIGDNLREVSPTLFLGVPRLFEKIYARMKERAYEGGRAKAAIFNWAMSVGKAYARCVGATGRDERVPLFLALKHWIADRLVFSKWRAALGGRIRLFVSGGAALPDEIAYIYVGAGLPILQGYGLSETSPVISASTLHENRIGTVGRPIRSIEVRTARDGEIEVRGPNVMRGYFNKPDETREAFTEDGWLKTGDIGAIDADGFLRITDRKKELFKTSGGKYIAPQSIEQKIMGSRFVNQVVLIGNGHKFPAALIVPDWSQLNAYAELKGISARTPAELCEDARILDLFERQVAALTTDLAKYERVKRIALLDREFSIDGGELTPTLKVKRRVIDEKYKAVIDRLYENAEITA